MLRQYFPVAERIISWEALFARNWHQPDYFWFVLNVNQTLFLIYQNEDYTAKWQNSLLPVHSSVKLRKNIWTKYLADFEILQFEILKTLRTIYRKIQLTSSNSLAKINAILSRCSSSLKYFRLLLPARLQTARISKPPAKPFLYSSQHRVVSLSIHGEAQVRAF